MQGKKRIKSQEKLHDKGVQQCFHGYNFYALTKEKETIIILVQNMLTTSSTQKYKDGKRNEAKRKIRKGTNVLTSYLTKGSQKILSPS